MVNYNTDGLFNLPTIGANLSNRTDLIGFNFSGTELVQCNFENSNLSGVIFEGVVDLSGSNFKNTNLTYADFSGVNVTGCDFREAKVNSTDFTNVTYNHTTLFKDLKITMPNSLPILPSEDFLYHRSQIKVEGFLDVEIKEDTLGNKTHNPVVHNGTYEYIDMLQTYTNKAPTTTQDYRQIFKKTVVDGSNQYLFYCDRQNDISTNPPPDNEPGMVDE